MSDYNPLILMSQGKPRNPDPKLTGAGITQAWTLAKHVLEELLVGTQAAPDIFLKSPQRRGQSTAAWLQIVYEAWAASQKSICPVATFDCFRETSMTLGSSIAGARFPDGEFHIMGQYSHPEDKHWASAESAEFDGTAGLKGSARVRALRAMELRRGTDALNMLASMTSKRNRVTGQSKISFQWRTDVRADRPANCRFVGFTHSRLANGLLARCLELRSQNGANFEIDDPDFYYTQGREHTFRLTRTGDPSVPLLIECTAARSLPYFPPWHRSDEVPTLEAFKSTVWERLHQAFGPV